MLRRRSLLKQAGDGEVALKFELGKGKGNGFREKRKKQGQSTLQYCRHKLQKQFVLSLDSARQVRHRRLQPRPDPCQDATAAIIGPSVQI
jgi:hypothetical protein